MKRGREITRALRRELATADFLSKRHNPKVITCVL